MRHSACGDLSVLLVSADVIRSNDELAIGQPATPGARLGERLRAQRELQQLTLDTIAERTKIRVPLLEALEHDDVSQWPGGLFRRSYLRSYAAAIGLDPEQTVRDFLAMHPDQVEEPKTAAEAAAAETARASRRPGLLHTLLGSFLGGQKPQAAEKTPVPAPSLDVEVETPAVAPLPDLQIDKRPEPFEEFTLTAPSIAEVSAPPADVDLPGVARLCTRLAKARAAADLEPLMADAARLLNARGIIVWLWNQDDGRLWPSLSHGYSPEVLAQLPAIRVDAQNAIAASFRTGTLQVVPGGHDATGAVAAPIATPSGCSGVLAFECTHGLERDDAVHALAGIVAAQLSMLCDATPAAHAAIA